MSTSIANTQAYGSWPRGFTLDLPNHGYFVSCGQNNSGKSSLLQRIFGEGGGLHSILIPAERNLIVDNTNPLEDLESAIGNFRHELRGKPLDIVQISAESNTNLTRYAGRLPNLLINNQGILESVGLLNEELLDFKLPAITLRGGGTQQIIMAGRSVGQHGSGVRSLLTILAALVHPDIDVILIDEPEVALEPSVQKLLRDKLQHYAEQKLIVVATHSHLFLNRIEGQHDRNFRIFKDEHNNSQLERCNNPTKLQELTFNLLGNSLEDLFMPSNYLIVEGYSDQQIVKKVLALMNAENKLVQVVSASGITNVSNKIRAVCEQVLPLYMSSSPYNKRVVALVDAPNNTQGELTAVDDLKQALGTRLKRLNKTSIEEYLPEALYIRADIDKVQLLGDIQRAKDRGDKIKERALKEEASNKIAQVIDLQDLNTIPIIKSTVQKALNSA